MEPGCNFTLLPPSVFTQKSDDEEPDGIFTFKRKAHVRYYGVSASICNILLYLCDVLGGKRRQLHENMQVFVLSCKFN